eukprot:jgi/Galph1/5480/GphlegSOOS_G4164.1
MECPVILYINDKKHEIYSAPHKLLIEYLRENCNLTGTKLGCGEGGCGACTVSLWTVEPSSQQTVAITVNSCLVTLGMVDGCYITTIEGVGKRKGPHGLHPIQQCLANQNGSQCGFCTPGILLSMYGILEKCKNNQQVLTVRDIEDNFDGNLCRCTGYRPILDSFRQFVDSLQSDKHLLSSALARTTCPSTEVLQELAQRRQQFRTFHSGKDFPHETATAKHIIYFRPYCLEQVITTFKSHPQAKLMIGNTEVGIESKFKNMNWNDYILLTDVKELQVIELKDDGVVIGAAVTLSRLSDFIEHLKDGHTPRYQLSALLAIQKQLRWFAGTQIRNIASLGGNIVTASPISDLNPLLVAANAQLTWYSCVDECFYQKSAQEFFIGYRTTLLKHSDVLVNIMIPWTNPLEVFHAYKVSRRREDDIAIVSAGIRLQFVYYTSQQERQDILELESVSLAFGGMADCTKIAKHTENVIRNSKFSLSLLPQCFQALDEDFPLSVDSPGGMPQYRKTLAASFLFRSFHKANRTLHKRLQRTPALWPLDHSNLYAAKSLNMRVSSRGFQFFEDNKNVDPYAYIGSCTAHVSAELQCSGEALYVDDIPSLPNTLYAAMILSSEPRAKIRFIDCTAAEKQQGVVKILFAKDVPGSNRFGITAIEDELVFWSEQVTAVGQVIGLVVADCKEHAKVAAKAVIVNYEKLPAILTIEEALKNESFAPFGNDGASLFSEGNGIINGTCMPPQRIERGDVDMIFSQKHLSIVNGDVRIGAQEHFYLETQATIPGENDEMLVYASTQSPGKTQAAVAKVLGLDCHKVVCKTKRIGGGFGGKETRNIFLTCAVAVAAFVLQQPVRIFLDRDEDMLVSGHRHPFLGRYRVAFDNEGIVHAVETFLYANMGNTMDLSLAVLDRALFHSENVYNIPNVRFLGRLCYTNTISNTAFRGFGAPQAMAIAETWIEHVAYTLSIAPEVIRELNMYHNEDETPYGMKLLGWTGWDCWHQVLESSDYYRRKERIETWNTQHLYRKKGIAVLCSKFGMSFTNKTYNQGSSLVHIYLDGSVLVTHGGVEMGQGLHTKIIQIVATELQVPLHKVYIAETSTDKVANASPTAASSSTDLYGMAVKDACAQLKERLLPIRSQLQQEKIDASWEDLIRKAYKERISLMATGFYRTPEIDAIDLSKNEKGNPFYYFTVGAAVSEVELDVLTGEYMISQTDIVMDIGRSINPSIDIGQIEGAFVQGLGLFTMEEVVFGDEEHPWFRQGQLFTRGPSTYKIPGFHDIPITFRVGLLPNVINHRPSIHSSKGIGEPPLFLSFSVFSALRHAIQAARRDHSLTSFFTLDSPLTVERIRMACGDEIVQHVLKEDQELHCFRAKLSC